MSLSRLGMAATLAIATAAWAQPAPTPATATAQLQSAVSLRIAYGPNASQFGELRLPSGPGPHPVLVLVHGGCWLSQYDLHLMDDMAEAFTKAGYATWNIEFHRTTADSPGWPQIFTDVVLATDFLRNLATTYPLKLDDVVAIGHSSGGHLVLLLAEQSKGFAQNFPISIPRVSLSGVVAIAPVTDLRETLRDSTRACHKVIESFMGVRGTQDLSIYSAASPGAGVPELPRVLLSGGRDDIVLAAHVEEYDRVMRSRGVATSYLEVADADHMDLISPSAPAWKVLLQALKSLPSKATP